VEISTEKDTLLLCECHLSAGPEFAETRLTEIRGILNLLKKEDQNVFICGDFNEDLDPKVGVCKLLIEGGFLIGDVEAERLKNVTCDKMRSALQ